MVGRVLVGCALCCAVACSGDSGDDTGPLATSSPATGCAPITTASLWPADGAANYYRDLPVWAEVSTEDAVLRLLDASGAEVSGSLTDSADYEGWKVYQPDAPLAAGATYTLELEQCGGVSSSTFTVSPTGEAPTTADLSGAVWTLSLRSQVGPFQTVSEVLAQFSMLGHQLAVVAVNGDSLDLEIRNPIIATDTCAAPSPLTADFSGNPTLVSEPFELCMELETSDESSNLVVLHDAVMTAEISPDGTRVDNMAVRAEVDGRELTITGETGCDALDVFGVTCEECSDGSGAYCMPFELTYASGSQ